MTTATTATATATQYVDALAATAELEQPFGAAALMLLTTLTRRHELLCPTTSLREGWLHVTPSPRQREFGQARIVPVGRSVGLTVGDGSGEPVACLLGIERHELPRFGDHLSTAMRRHPVLAKVADGDAAWTLAVESLTQAHSTSAMRGSVLRYAGIHCDWPPDPSPRGLLAVAAAVDSCVQAAGFGLNEQPDDLSA